MHLCIIYLRRRVISHSQEPLTDKREPPPSCSNLQQSIYISVSGTHCLLTKFGQQKLFLSDLLEQTFTVLRYKVAFDNYSLEVVLCSP